MQSSQLYDATQPKTCETSPETKSSLAPKEEQKLLFLQQWYLNAPHER
jgi:hypothetical protein